MVARFEGYKPGYSASIGTDKNYLTWVILKAHTNNTAGVVTLKNDNPLEPPSINFKQFHDGGDADVRAVVDGMQFVRRLNSKLRAHGIGSSELLPGSRQQSEADLSEHVRRHAWGHHACGTCAIGPANRGGVVGSDFRVHNTTNLRIVDASVFPRIPGFFIACAVYIVGEKAGDVILADARR